MAFSFTKLGEFHIGGTHRVYGTYANSGGSTGGTINTGLAIVNGMSLDPVGTADTLLKVNSLPPLTATDGAVIITTTANLSGIWEAWGI